MILSCSGLNGALAFGEVSSPAADHDRVGAAKLKVCSNDADSDYLAVKNISCKRGEAIAYGVTQKAYDLGLESFDELRYKGFRCSGDYYTAYCVKTKKSGRKVIDFASD